MRPGWHILEVDRINFFSISNGTIACIVSKAVLDTNNNPSIDVSFRVANSVPTLNAHHKFVKTTPNPRATKNSRGELVGPPPPLDWLVVVVGADDVVVDV
jgi:hypothetical protein